MCGQQAASAPEPEDLRMRVLCTIKNNMADENINIDENHDSEDDSEDEKALLLLLLLRRRRRRLRTARR